jgi:hypothetical protein
VSVVSQPRLLKGEWPLEAQILERCAGAAPRLAAGEVRILFQGEKTFLSECEQGTLKSPTLEGTLSKLA